MAYELKGMKDRELVKAVARAAGNPRGEHRCPIGPSGIITANDLYWCPLDDDGDALRLAVLYRMKVDATSGDAASVRRAIVVAAASMAAYTHTDQQPVGD